jgi:hypothetical protein
MWLSLNPWGAVWLVKSKLAIWGIMNNFSLLSVLRMNWWKWHYYEILVQSRLYRLWITIHHCRKKLPPSTKAKNPHLLWPTDRITYNAITLFSFSDNTWITHVIPCWPGICSSNYHYRAVLLKLSYFKGTLKVVLKLRYSGVTLEALWK